MLYKVFNIRLLKAITSCLIDKNHVIEIKLIISFVALRFISKTRKTTQLLNWLN